MTAWDSAAGWDSFGGYRLAWNRSMERRLAAILVADVVGYSRLMGRDEAGTLARLSSLRREFL